MFMKFSKSIVAVATVALSLAAVANFSFAANSSGSGPQVFNVGGKEYRTIPVDVGNVVNNNAMTPTLDTEKIQQETKVADDLEKLKKIVTSIAPEQDGGAYTDEEGNNVFLLTGKNPDLENKLKASSQQPDKVKVKYVKYSESQLNDTHQKMNNLTNLGITLLVTDIKQNKVNVLISEEALNKNKATILKNLDENMINWQIGDYKIVDQSAILYPGEKVERVAGSSTFSCSIAFDAKTSSNTKVAVTAGHCGNGTWYDQSDQTEGVVLDSNNNPVYAIFSKLVNAYDGLGLTGVYVEST
jgi:hypothetical protein